ncbi:disease resistance protein L6-like [Cryptomeria japonica]|uniref:disease resistance protein L6-like n=1 Tax=Cryptomeria japonica TaxID=3369 RepID=UPI0027DA9839|nr:disease resistance protein L6-like [Cryptomeria japonica]
MASTSNTSTPQYLEESAPSTSTMPVFVIYKPPADTDKLAVLSDNRYHVFLSFRGEDVRKTLVDHLYEALSTVGLNVYKDDDKLEKGEEIWPSLERAIESSAFRIPVFSKGYADSIWCLKEAAAMLKTPGLIIPLFYHMDPTQVRYPENKSSPYRQPFLKHYSHSDRYSKEVIDVWKNSLEKICSRSGWSTDITQG